MFKGTIYLFAGQSVLVATTLVLHAFLGRTLGPETYGVFGVISSLIIFNEMFFLRAASEAVSKFVAEDTGTVRSVLKVGLKFQICIGLILGLIFYGFSSSIAGLLRDPSISVYIKIISVMFPISAVAFTYIGALNGMRYFGQQSAVMVLFAVSRLVGVILLVYLGYGLVGVIAGLIISSLVQLWIARRSCSPLREEGEFNIGKLAVFMPQLLVISIITAILMNIDIIAVKVALMDNRLTGLYVSAVTISRVPIIFLAPLTMTLFPSIASVIGNGNNDDVNVLINKSIKYLLIPLMPLILLILATSEELIAFVYGDLYTDASFSLSILIAGALFFTVKAIMYNVIVASGKPRIVIYIGILSVFLDVILIAAMINRFQLTGVALAMAITHFLGFFLSVAYIRYRFKTTVNISSILRIVAASGIICYLATLIPENISFLPLNYLLLFILYTSLLIFMKEIDINDIKSFKGLCAEKLLSLRSG